jgi:HEAT repeat protein
MRLLKKTGQRSSTDVALLNEPPDSLLELIAKDGLGDPWLFRRAARTVGSLQLEEALSPLRDALERHAGHLGPSDDSFPMRSARDSRFLAESAAEGLTLLGSPRALASLRPFLEGPPPFAGWVALRVGEAGHEVAREPLFSIVGNPRYDGVLRGRAAGLLVNRFQDRRGLAQLAAALAAESEEEFEVALSAFHGVESVHRDDAYFAPVLAGLEAQMRCPERLAGLLGLVLGAEALESAVVARLGTFLGDRRRHSGRFLAAGPPSLERLAVAGLARSRWQRGQSTETEQAAYSRNPIRYWALRRRVEKWLKTAEAFPERGGGAPGG